MRILLTVLISLTFLCVQNAPGGEPPSSERVKNTTEKDNIALGPVHFYQKYISPAIGGSCPMEPCCSNYCIHAVKKHGILLGWMMTCDRLMRCGRDEIKQAPVIRIRHTLRYYDPVSENDFWLK